MLVYAKIVVIRSIISLLMVNRQQDKTIKNTIIFTNHTDDNIVKLKKLNINEVFVIIQKIHPSLSDVTKTIIERVNKTKILFGLFG